MCHNKLQPSKVAKEWHNIPFKARLGCQNRLGSGTWGKKGWEPLYYATYDLKRWVAWQLFGDNSTKPAMERYLTDVIHYSIRKPLIKPCLVRTTKCIQAKIVVLFSGKSQLTQIFLVASSYMQVGINKYKKVKKMKSAMQQSLSERAYSLKIGLSLQLSGYPFSSVHKIFPECKRSQ